MFHCNVLMCADVACLMPLSYIHLTHNWLRRAGGTGNQTVKELVARGLVPIAVECGNGPVPIKLKDDDSGESTKNLIILPLPTSILARDDDDDGAEVVEKGGAQKNECQHEARFPKVFILSAELFLRCVPPWNDIICKDDIGQQPSLSSPASLILSNDSTNPTSLCEEIASVLHIHTWLDLAGTEHHNTSSDDTVTVMLQQRLNRTVRNLQPAHIVLGDIMATTTTTTAIPSKFLEGCSSVTSIDLSPLSSTTTMTNITTIQDKFLSGCFKLKTLDCTPLSGITHIGEEFLGGCAGLQDLDMTMMNKVVHIGMSFLANCTGVRDVKVSRAIAHSSVRCYGFLQQCSRLCSMSFQPFEGISEIPHAFLMHCSYLREVDLTPLLPPSTTTTATIPTTTLLHRVNTNCLAHCTRLKCINLSALRNVTKIGANFLSECVSLSEIDITPLGKVVVIGKRFLGGCVGLTSIDLTPLISIVTIDQGMLHGCVGICSIRISMGGGTSVTATALPAALVNDDRVTIDWVY